MQGEWYEVETNPPSEAMPKGALVWDGHHISVAYPAGVGADIWVDEYANEVFPTHWQPLPAPPVTPRGREVVDG